MAWSKLVSTELSDEQKLDMAMPSFPIRDMPDYPPGMSITMDDALLDKLGLSHDVDVGDLLDMRCFAVVRSVHKTEDNGKATCRVCLVIEKIACEDEMSEPAPGGDDD